MIRLSNSSNQQVAHHTSPLVSIHSRICISPICYNLIFTNDAKEKKYNGFQSGYKSKHLIIIYSCLLVICLAACLALFLIAILTFFLFISKHPCGSYDRVVGRIVKYAIDNYEGQINVVDLFDKFCDIILSIITLRNYV